MIVELLLAAGVVMLASLAGVVFVHKVAREFLETRLAYLVSFSAGVFLVTAGALMLEAFELFTSPLVAAGWIAVGYVLAWGLHFVLPEVHHHHDPTCGKRHGGARRLIAGDAIHNVADGIILVPAFLVSPALGIAVTTSIVIHEALQEISEFFVLRQAGFSTARALAINFFVSSTILIGVAISYFALASLAVEGVLLALAAGFFFNVVLHDLLPSRRVHGSGAKLVEHVLILAIGVIAMASVNTLLGDSHAHGEGDEHDESGNEHGHGEEAAQNETIVDEPDAVRVDEADGGSGVNGR